MNGGLTGGLTGGALEQMARSLRVATAPLAGGGEEGLEEVLATVRRRARRRRLIAVLGLQAALASFGFGAWAAASGRLGALLDSIRPAPEAPAAPTPARSTRRAATRHAAPVAGVSAPTAPEPRVRPARTMAAAPVDRPPAPAALDRSALDEQDRRYQRAHEAHFVRRDWAAALAAWDHYLALPRLGRLALEARYNRAIALYRLGRRLEAAQALQPFADGDYGPYRQAEARALLKQP